MSAKYCPGCGRNYEGCTACDPPTMRPIPTAPTAAGIDLREPDLAEIAALKADLAELLDGKRHRAFVHCDQGVPHVSMAAFGRKISEKRNAIAQRAEAVDHARVLEATLARVRNLAEDMRTWCSPHNFAIRCAGAIDEALAEPTQQGDPT